tara:strand:+ start:1655 stop:1867 length:213 start_codon:yes stop_codon:yes gene_type:complete
MVEDRVVRLLMSENDIKIVVRTLRAGAAGCISAVGLTALPDIRRSLEERAFVLDQIAQDFEAGTHTLTKG